MDKKNNSDIWAIDVGDPSIFLAEWKVYLANAGKKQMPACTVQFHSNVNAAIDLLPHPVKKLARLLDGTLGSGKMEPYRTTARHRMYAEHTWANIATRPWVTKELTRNTRAEVDAGLKKWALNVKSFYKLYSEINRQYPIAQRALEKYYTTKFGMPPNEAKSKATSSLDVAYRTYFLFSKLDI